MILIEDGPGGGFALFDGAEALILAQDAQDLAPALARLDAARAQGKWVAGYIGYEAGYALEPKLAGLMPEADEARPLLLFGVCGRPSDAAAVLAQAAGAARGVRDAAGALRVIAHVAQSAPWARACARARQGALLPIAAVR